MTAGSEQKVSHCFLGNISFWKNKEFFVQSIISVPASILDLVAPLVLPDFRLEFAACSNCEAFGEVLLLKYSSSNMCTFAGEELVLLINVNDLRVLRYSIY